MARGSALGSASTWQNALGCFPLKGRRAAAILGMAAPNRGGWPWALGACLLALRALGHFHEDWENGPGHAWYEQPWVSHVQDFYCDDDCEARLLRATLIDREFKALGRRVQLHDGRAEGGIPRRLRGARRVQGWRRRHHATRGTRPRPRALIPHRLTSPRLPTPTRVLPTGTCDSPSIPHPARAGEQQHVEVHGRMGDHPHSAHVHAHIVHLAQARWVPPPPQSRRDLGAILAPPRPRSRSRSLPRSRSNVSFDRFFCYDNINATAGGPLFHNVTSNISGTTTTGRVDSM